MHPLSLVLLRVVVGLVRTLEIDQARDGGRARALLVRVPTADVGAILQGDPFLRDRLVKRISLHQ